MGGLCCWLRDCNADIRFGEKRKKGKKDEWTRSKEIAGEVDQMKMGSYQLSPEWDRFTL